MIGQTIGHYRILEKLGEGGMGVVYLAEDTTLKRQVALKALPPDLATNQEHLDRFHREAEALAALDHPCIVTIYSIESATIPNEEEFHYLTMQYVEGKRLSDWIPTGGMTVERVFEVAIPLADALAAAIAAMGNYGEIYDRYLGPSGLAFTLGRGPNELWTNGGLIYAPPIK